MEQTYSFIEKKKPLTHSVLSRITCWTLGAADENTSTGPYKELWAIRRETNMWWDQFYSARGRVEYRCFQTVHFAAVSLWVSLIQALFDGY